MFFAKTEKDMPFKVFEVILDKVDKWADELVEVHHMENLRTKVIRRC